MISLLILEIYEATKISYDDDTEVDANFSIVIVRDFSDVRYSFDKVSGSVSDDQEAYIDTFARQLRSDWLQPLSTVHETWCGSCKHFASAISWPDIRAYVMLIDELLYVTVNTVPTIAYAVNCLARYMTKATPQHYEFARQVLRFLKDIKHRKLTWCVG